MTSHIAQLNIGRFRYSTDDPRMAAFMGNLDRINALAERSEGFVWRLKDDSNNATAIRPASDPTMAGNLPGWDLHNLNMSGCSFDALNMSGWRVHNVNLAGLRIDKANLAGATIANARLDSATIDGIALTDLLAYWRAGREAKSA